MKEVASWERKFQVWQYSVSHSTLLLRSVHPQLYETRIDILFPAVSFMQLRPSYDTLTISEADESETEELLPSGVNASEPGNLYVINHGQGYVMAPKCSWFEDQGDHRAPSKFGPLRGTK
ncbi:hypothetical protein [Streptomyces sp. Ru73]|uniref:hypothetical protein n=1 Tax=Streptomyces sp. Ru73 TaxID=2080748 RepID=UPI0011B03CB1|nr:hypothetical protein [Streptomyces sp. Ru73]